MDPRSSFFRQNASLRLSAPSEKKTQSLNQLRQCALVSEWGVSLLIAVPQNHTSKDIIELARDIQLTLVGETRTCGTRKPG